MNAGKLRHRVTVQRLVKQDDGYGGIIETWQDVATLWAVVEPLRGWERFAAQQVQSALSHKVTLRYRPGITPQMRLLYGTRVLTVESVVDVGERHERLELLCSEVLPSA